MQASMVNVDQIPSHDAPSPLAAVRPRAAVHTVAGVAGVARVAGVVIAFAAALTSIGCWSPTVHTSFDPSADFAQLKNYAIVPNHQEIIAIRMLDGRPMAQTIAQAVGRALDARGYSAAADPAHAQMLVRWTAAIEQSAPLQGPNAAVDPEIQEMATGIPGDTGGGAGGPVEGNTQAGTLVIDIYDTRAKRKIWTGIVAAGMDPDLPDPKRVKRLNEALAKLFAKFPPTR